MKRLKHMTWDVRLYRFIGYVLMIFIVLISTVPFIWVFLSSFKTNQEILSSAFSLPSRINLDGYKIAIDVADIPNRFVNSVLVSSSATLLALVIYSMAAYGFARFHYKSSGFLFSLLICSMLIPSVAMSQPIFSTFSALNLYDTRTALILVYSAFAMPSCLFILRNSFLSVPREIKEAAFIDGAGTFKTFFTITLPLARPGLACAAVLTFIDSWNELLYSMLLTSSEKIRTLPLAMKHFVSTFSFNYPSLLAAVVLCIIPTLVTYVLLQEQIMESMVAGSVKG